MEIIFDKKDLRRPVTAFNLHRVTVDDSREEFQQAATLASKVSVTFGTVTIVIKDAEGKTYHQERRTAASDWL